MTASKKAMASSADPLSHLNSERSSERPSKRRSEHRSGRPSKRSSERRAAQAANDPMVNHPAHQPLTTNNSAARHSTTNGFTPHHSAANNFAPHHPTTNDFTPHHPASNGLAPQHPTDFDFQPPAGRPTKPARFDLRSRFIKPPDPEEFARRRAAITEEFLKPVDSFDLRAATGLKPSKRRSSSLGRSLSLGRASSSGRSTSLSRSSSARANSRNSRRPKNSKKPRSRLRKFFIALLILFLLGIAAFLIWGDTIISRLTGGKSGIFDAFNSLIQADVPLQTDQNGRTNILIFGTSGYDMAGSEGNGVHDGAQLTDSIMILSLDQKTSDVALLNIPRDLKVDNACMAGKINEVYYCHNSAGADESVGARALQTQIAEITGLTFQYYAHVDWSALVQLVDAIGGITVTLDQEVSDRPTKTYIPANTPTRLNGTQALGLARARKGTANGDFTRGDNQQKIIIALAEKALDRQLGLSETLNLINVLGDNLRSDFDTNEIKTLANTFRSFDLHQIRQIPLIDPENNLYYFKTATLNGISYVIPAAGVHNYQDIQQYLAQNLSSDPAVREAAAILILNGTSTPGRAAAAQADLQAAHFTNSEIDDAPTSDYDQNFLYALSDTKPATQAALEEFYHLTAHKSAALPAGLDPAFLSQTYDFVLILGR